MRPALGAHCAEVSSVDHAATIELHGTDRMCAFVQVGGGTSCRARQCPEHLWIEHTQLDFTAGEAYLELQVEKEIFTLHDEVTSQFEKTESCSCSKRTGSETPPVVFD
jgi:hypothetical protein